MFYENFTFQNIISYFQTFFFWVVPSQGNRTQKEFWKLFNDLFNKLYDLAIWSNYSLIFIIGDKQRKNVSQTIMENLLRSIDG